MFPLGILSVAPALMPSFTPALMFSVSDLIVSDASPSSSVEAPVLMPFFPFAVIDSSPLPQSVMFDPALALITAFSALVLSG